MSERFEMTAVGEHTYSITTGTGRGETTHEVVVPAQLLFDLGLTPDDEARLVRASFEFLLEREPSSSILRHFELDVIGRYFPEYMDTMRRRLAADDA
jgi:hypothetical protein